MTMGGGCSAFPIARATSVAWALHVFVIRRACSLACRLGDVAVRSLARSGVARRGVEEWSAPPPTLWNVGGGGGEKQVVVVVGGKQMVTQVTANVTIWVVTFERHGK